MILQEVYPGLAQGPCTCCEKEKAVIAMQGVAKDGAKVELCVGCSLQVARKLIEDVCAVATPGGRHG